jgi:uncharacterized membrane protein YphA (DoxX/SURF4 family)
MHMTQPLSSWTMPTLRFGMGVFIAAWGLDKLMATEVGQRIFSGAYSVNLGATLVQVAGIAEIVLGLALAAGLLRVVTAWLVLAINLTSTLSVWRQILDPWGAIGLTDGDSVNHLFLASIVIVAASVVLVLNARDDTATLDRRLGISPARADRSPTAGRNS